MTANNPDLINTKGFALITLFMWLVPHIFVEIAQYRLALIKSPNWEREKLAQGFKVIAYQSSIAIAIYALLVSGTAVGVSLSTKDMNINMLYLLSGLSRLLSAISLFLISVQIPTWLGVYHRESNVDSPIYSIKALRFEIWWSMWRYFFRVYFLIMPFFCDTIGPAEIPIFIVAGIIGGILICLGVYYGRTKFKEQKKMIVIIMVVILCILSSFSFAGGCWYIQYAWFPKGDTNRRSTIWIAAIFSSLAVGAIFHVVVWRWSTKRFNKDETRRNSGATVRSAMFTTAIFHPKHFFNVKASGVIRATGVTTSKRHPAPSLDALAEDRLEEEESSVDNEVFKEDTLEPNVHHMYCSNENLKNQTRKQVETMHSKYNNEDKIDSDYPKDDLIHSEYHDEDLVDEETTCSLIKAKCCCGRNREQERRNKRLPQKIFMATKRIVWCLASLCALFITIVNIGATEQVHITMNQLPVTYEILYNHMDGGPVCAFFDTKSGGPYNVTTYESASVALSLNQTILHCGACGACSTWNNLKLEWTTRKVLGEKSKTCALQGLLSQGNGSLQCMYDTVGFDEACSKCWIDDMSCANKNCAFIGLQQMIINTLSNLTVAPGAITAATCEEAMCELDFVPCSGASRRRMNIHSDIERPKNQKCTIVNGSQWVSYFGP